MRERRSNIEALRVISMVMIITLHYLLQGGILESITLDEKLYSSVWLIEAMCYVSVNCYVLISGYFLVDSKFRLRKLVNLIAETCFYSVSIFFVCCLTGLIPFDIKFLLMGDFYPIIHGSWWFSSVYVVLYLIFPFLNLLINAMGRNQHKIFLVVLTIAFSLVPSVFPTYVDVIGLESGYSLIWFIYLYLLAGYIKRYDLVNSQCRNLLLFIGCSLLTTITKIIQQVVIGKEHWHLYKYSSITVLIASIGLFLYFINTECKILNVRGWNLLGKHTYAVFLIHTQYYVRDWIWKELFQPKKYIGVGLIPHMFFSIICIFGMCFIIDVVRTYVSKKRRLYK